MGSRLIHAAIAQKLMTIHSFLDDAFFLGNEAPDADKTSDLTKGDTHFLVPNNRGTQRIDLRQFLTQYPSSLTNNFMLGYYTHLVADELWLQDIFSHHIPAGPVGVRQQLLTLYYQDFQQLNRFLINQYALVPYERDITPVVPTTVNLDALRQLMAEYNHDFDLIDERPLQLLQQSEVDNHIAKVVKMMTNMINSGQLVEQLIMPQDKGDL